MKKNDPIAIGNVLRRFLRDNGLESPLNEYRLINAWTEVLGPVVANYTENLFIKNQTLYVHITSAVLREELMMSRDLLVKNLNRHIGATVITQLVFC